MTFGDDLVALVVEVNTDSGPDEDVAVNIRITTTVQ
jgi:hypothetical protein